QVMWIAKTHVVRAVNADREIIIKVGGKSATVNGQQVTMDKAAFIEKGRTIVPLSFVGQALDVNIKYDPATGHLDITSK
ncbi:MAG: copper amine oxidase N-terminal domain-containing protein, partial [bacterium]